MRTPFILLITSFLSVPAAAQVDFEPGYWTGNDGIRRECEILNVDWRFNPESFEYRMQPGGEQLTATLAEVREFGVTGKSRYVREAVQIDRSSNQIDKLTPYRNPVFSPDTLFLKVIVEGRASLYRYESKQVLRFFYSLPDSPVQQLIYRRYQPLGSTAVYTNYDFRFQLQRDLSCGAQRQVEIACDEPSLARFFEAYNGCIGESSVRYGVRDVKALAAVRIRPGFSMASARFSNPAAVLEGAKFPWRPTFRLGFEFEQILPFNQGRWSLLAEPTLQFYQDTHIMFPGTSYTSTVRVRYRSVELPVGFRYYLFLNPDTRLFLNGLMTIDFSFGSTYASGFETRKIFSSINPAAGAGIRWKRYQAEFRYQHNRQLMRGYTYWSGRYRSLSLILGYTLGSTGLPAAD